MALRGTLTHRKVRRLAQYLQIDACFALGIVEALWHVTGEQAHDGAIGRMTDEDIAMEMFYSRDPETLIAALVKAELLDEHPEHRVIVHDWHIHSDDATDNKLARAGQRYANGEPPRMRRMSEKERGKCGARYAEIGDSMRTHAHAVRTNGHERPLPEPVPEPEPEPVPEPVIKTKAKAAASAFVLPDWIDVETWRGFEEMRKKTRKPMTDRARTLAVGELERLQSSGNDPTAVLNQSTMNSWAGLFAVSAPGGSNGTHFKSNAERKHEADRESSYWANIHAFGVPDGAGEGLLPIASGGMDTLDGDRVGDGGGIQAGVAGTGGALRDGPLRECAGQHPAAEWERGLQVVPTAGHNRC